MFYMLGSGTSALETIIAAVPTLFTLVGTVITQIVGNPVLTFFAAIPIRVIKIIFRFLPLK